MSDFEVLQDLLTFECQKVTKGATPEQISNFEKVLGVRLPSTLKALLQISNGGEFIFGKFEKNPYIPDDVAKLDKDSLWKKITEGCKLDSHEEVTSQRYMPLCSDFGVGMYCLDLSKIIMPVVFIDFGSKKGDPIENTASDFTSFLEDAISEYREAEREDQKDPYEYKLTPKAESDLDAFLTEMEGKGVI